jgi:hypothetical protein
MAIIARAILLAICVATLSACGNSYDTKLSALETFMRWMKIGGQDYWLEKRGVLDTGEWYKVGMIFG